MAVSFISSTTSFLQNYGSHILPVAAELVDVVVFKSTTSSSKGLFAGYIAVTGVLFFFDKKISLAVGLAGPILLIIYKVITQKQDPLASIEDAENKWNALTTKLVFESKKKLNYTAQNFHIQFTEHTKELRPQTEKIRANWKNRDLLIEAKEMMLCCQKILFKVHTSLEQKTASLLLMRETRLQKMAKILNDHAMEKQDFDSAFTLLNKIYRLVRSKGYMIALPNISNYPDRNFSSIVTGETINLKDCDRFFTKTGEQHEMNMIFNDTQNRLSALLKLIYPGSPLNAKDEQSLPGDYGNPTNPFRINT